MAALSVAAAATGVASVAAFWAVVARSRRQKHREMPPPGASAPAFAATVEPESMQERVLKVACCVHRFLISGPNLGINARISSFTPSFVRRFLISGPDLGIDARISPLTPSFVHRFLISGSDLGIDARFSRFTATCVHRFLILGGQFGNRCMDCPETASLLQRFLISGPDLRITAAPSSQQCGMARLQLSLRLRWFASDSNFRSGKEE